MFVIKKVVVMVVAKRLWLVVECHGVAVAKLQKDAINT